MNKMIGVVKDKPALLMVMFAFGSALGFLLAKFVRNNINVLPSYYAIVTSILIITTLVAFSVLFKLPKKLNMIDIGITTGFIIDFTKYVWGW